MILCVNPNAAIDKTVVVSPFHLNEIHRPQQVIAIAGGKGCNVARALKRFGETPVVTGWVGGYAGRFIEDGLHREGIQTDFIHTEFESRTCLSILDTENDTVTEIYEKGEQVPDEKVEEFRKFFQTAVRECAAVTMSGSVPPGVPPDFYREIIELAHATDIPTFLDSSGESLKRGIVAQPTLVKPNESELADLVGEETLQTVDLARAAVEVSRQHNTVVVLSLGPDGAIATNGQEALQVRPPALQIKSAVGSGDSLLAGITYALTHDFVFETAVRYGVAAGTANALEIGAGVFALKDFKRILSEVTTTRL